MADFNLEGVGVAIVTPFTKDYLIDYKALELLITHILEGGCDYIVALGTTAETPTLSREEKKELLKFIKKTTGGRVPIIAGLGGNNTHALVKEIQETDLEGCAAILSVTPYYNKPTQEGLYQHFMAVAESSPIPVLLYNVPTRTGVNLSADTVLRLARSSNKFIGIKEASSDKDQWIKIADNSPEWFNLVSGNDSSICEMMKVGAKGVISVLANAYPSVVKNHVKLCLSKNFDMAEQQQNKLNPFILHLFEEGNPAGIKAVLAQIGIGENILRLPLLPVNKNLESKLIEEIKEILLT